jgi:hypothetical protein
VSSHDGTATDGPFSSVEDPFSSVAEPVSSGTDSEAVLLCGDGAGGEGVAVEDEEAVGVDCESPDVSAVVVKGK